MEEKYEEEGEEGDDEEDACRGEVREAAVECGEEVAIDDNDDDDDA